MHIFQFSNLTLILVFSEEIAFYQGNKREHITVKSTFKRLVSILSNYSSSYPAIFCLGIFFYFLRCNFLKVFIQVQSLTYCFIGLFYLHTCDPSVCH